MTSLKNDADGHRRESSMKSPDTNGDDGTGIAGWQFYYWHRGAERAFQMLLECLLNRDRSGNPRGLRIIGESRVGKSAFLLNATARMANEYPQLAAGFFVGQPPIESRDVDLAIRQHILEGARHPAAILHPKGSELRSNSDAVLRDCTGFAWDEGHQFYLEKTDHFRKQATHFLRLTMNRTRKPFLLIGTEVVNLFVDTNPELRNRFRPRVDLTRFSLDTDDDEQELDKFFLALTTASPVSFDPPLTGAYMQTRILCGTDGVPGNIMDLCERVINRAIRKAGGVVHQRHWFTAYEDEFPVEAVNFNPFAGHSDSTVLKQIATKRATKSTSNSSAKSKGNRGG